MPWKTTFDAELQLVEVVYQGPINAADLAAANAAAINLGKQYGTVLFLVDITEVKLDAGLADLYQLPAKQYVEKGVDQRTCIALVMPQVPAERERAKFYENACVNRGWRTRSFEGRQEAIAWLVSGET